MIIEDKSSDIRSNFWRGEYNILREELLLKDFTKEEAIEYVENIQCKRCAKDGKHAWCLGIKHISCGYKTLLEQLREWKPVDIHEHIDRIMKDGGLNE